METFKGFFIRGETFLFLLVKLNVVNKFLKALSYNSKNYPF